MDVKMPDRPMQPSEVMKAQAAMQKLKWQVDEAKMRSGRRRYTYFWEHTTASGGEQGLMSKGQLFQALEMCSIKGFT